MPRPLDGPAGARRLRGIRLVYIGRRPHGRYGNPPNQGADMPIAGGTVLVTGPRRGIGRALVAQALARVAARVYAGSRQPLGHPAAGATPPILGMYRPEHCVGT